ADTLHVKAVPDCTVDGQDIAMSSCSGLTTIVAEEATDTPFESVTMKLSILTPFTTSVIVDVPVPEYGAVPPDAATSQSKAIPIAAVSGQVTVTISDVPATLTTAEPEAVWPLASMTVKVSTNDPFTDSEMV